MLADCLLYMFRNSFPVVSNASQFTSKTRAIVTSLYSDDFALPVATLGQSLNTHNITERRIVMYLSDRISSRSLCIIRTAGWEPVPVPYIQPPHSGKGVFPRFADQFTKLNIWGFDKMGVDVLLYMDADTILRNRYDELWDLPYSFAAVPDMHGLPRGFVISFNAGVLLLRPSSTVLQDMLSKLETATYPLEQAEQAFLNTYFAPKTLRLPYVYNGNLAIKQLAPRVWSSIKNELRIVHYTVLKPFWNTEETPELTGEVHTDWAEKMRESINNAMNSRGGYFKEEVGWWSEAWEDLLRNHYATLDACS
jgi:inositol phosphorylceramide glucuronosyltransferase 1